MPLILPGNTTVTWTTDLFGNEGSTCPCLLANDTLVDLQSSLFSDILPHRDGILTLNVTDDHGQLQSFFYRLHLTDSGHYLLPTKRMGHRDFKKEQQQLRRAIRLRMQQLLRMPTTATPAPAIKEAG
jgi:hypothetical protein